MRLCTPYTKEGVESLCIRILLCIIRQEHTHVTSYRPLGMQGQRVKCAEIQCIQLSGNFRACNQRWYKEAYICDFDPNAFLPSGMLA